MCGGKKAATLSLLTLLFAGCETTAQLQDHAPDRVSVFHTDADRMSNCLLRDLSARLRTFALTRTADNAGVTISAELTDLSFDNDSIVQFSLRIAPAMPNEARVALWSRHSLMGSPLYADTIWPVVVQCERAA